MFKDKLNLKMQGIVDIEIIDETTDEVIEVFQANNILPQMYQNLATRLFWKTRNADLQPKILTIIDSSWQAGISIQDFINPDLPSNNNLAVNGSQSWAGYGFAFPTIDNQYPYRIVLKKKWLIKAMDGKEHTWNTMVISPQSSLPTNTITLQNPLTIGKNRKIQLTWRILL